MCRSLRGRIRAAVLLGLCGLLPLAGCGSAPLPAGRAELDMWVSGPARWLLLPADLRLLRRVETHADAVRFIEGFWACRDPDPGQPGNPVRQDFLERVEAADLLYPEKNLRGSLSDRGRALILLGPPSHLQVSREPTLAWDSQADTRVRLTSKHRGVEVWGYRMDDLPAPLVALAREAAKGRDEALTLTLKFVSDSNRTQLAEGDSLLELAARALVRTEY